MAKDKLKYKISIDPQFSEDGADLGIDEIAFVNNPAIMVKGMAFTNQAKPLHFKDDTKFRIAAPALIPMEIYREDEFGEYWVEFTQSEIEDIYVKLMSKNKDNLFNLEHNKESRVDAFILESWLVGKDNKADRSYSEFGIEVPEGTLMIVAQFNDKDKYKELVDNDQVGFSIEGFLGLKLSEINKINKQTKMENLMLPNGEHLIGEKIYVVKDGVVIEVKDVVEEVALEEVVEEEVALEEVVEDEVVEEVALEEVVEDEVVEEVALEEVVEEELAVDTVVDADAVLAIVQPKLDEIYDMLSELKAAMEVSNDDEVIEEGINEMGFSNKYSTLRNFLKK